MTHIVTRPCCNDAACVSVCPVNCIHPTPNDPEYGTTEMLYIDPDTCIDCGACVDVCPVGAIVPDTDSTDETETFQEINALFYSNKDFSRSVPARKNIKRSEGEKLRPLRVAIVGSGPAACYTAEDLLLRRELAVEVDMFERLPMPWGLARYGVAPDHQDTKAVINSFQRTASRENVKMYLNVTVGKHVAHHELAEHYDAIVYAVGAPVGRRLGIAGEALPGSYSATEFVAWYNGHPDFSDRIFDLSSKRAVVIGNGNVGLDVARILVSDPGDLARTDIARHAVDALTASTIEEVVIVGRRGPAHAAFTIKELLTLSSASTFATVVDINERDLDAASKEVADGGDPIAKAKLEIIRRLATADRDTPGKRIVFQFQASPSEILGDDRVRGLRVARTSSTDGKREREAGAAATTRDIECGLVLRSIGYEGSPIEPFGVDSVTGTIPNRDGRVTSAAGEALPGVYVSGWIKRGAKGVIGTNKHCANATVDCIIEDHRAGVLAAPVHGRDEIANLLSERQPCYLNFAGARLIDEYEKSLGRKFGAPRVKVVEVEEMLRIANADIL